MSRFFVNKQLRSSSLKLPFVRKYSQCSSYSDNTPASIKIYEVGPRDGLQNEPKVLPPSVKIEFINRLARTGLKWIETTSFVSPKWVPQFADAENVFRRVDKVEGVSYPVLVPNLKGLERAISVGAQEIAIFIAASETFSQKNTNCSIAESIKKYEPIVVRALSQNLSVRGYVSVVVDCPYEGRISPRVVAECTEKLLDMGCYEVSLADDVGNATTTSLCAMLKEVVAIGHPSKLAIHCHDTYGQALSNILTCLEFGITTVDCSVSGFGGCPYSRGATGNVATEDVVYMLNGLGVETGIDLEELVRVGKFICDAVGRRSDSRVARALGESKMQFYT